jgi:hypothetical protein
MPVDQHYLDGVQLGGVVDDRNCAWLRVGGAGVQSLYEHPDVCVGGDCDHAYPIRPGEDFQ